MRGALIHGVLLVVMLVYGYRTWTREKPNKVNVGDVVLWDKTEADLVSLEWKSDKKVLKIDRKSAGGQSYWWGSDTTIEKKPKPPTPPADAGSDSSGSGSAAAAGSGSAVASGSGAAGSGAAGSGAAGSGSAAPPAAPVAEEEKRTTTEFPLGDKGDTLIKNYLAARALRDLGKPSDEQKKDYKLTDSKTTIVVTFKDGVRTFLVGGSVYGGSDRYVVDEASGTAYVLSKELISGLEIGKSQIQLTDPRGFEAAKIASVTIDAGGKSKSAVRVTAGEEGKQVKTWGDPATKKPMQTMANFIDNSNNLRPTEYSTTLSTVGLQPIVTLTYKDEHDAVLGTLSLYKHDKAATTDASGVMKPAEVEYFIVTPKTRVAAIVRKDNAERAEQDVPTVFSEKEVDSIAPKGNPFGKVKPDTLEGNGSAAKPPSPHGGPGGPPPGGPGSPPPGDPHGMTPHGAMPQPAPTGTQPTPTPAPKPAAPAPKPAAPAPKPAAPAPAPAPTPKAAGSASVPPPGPAPAPAP